MYIKSEDNFFNDMDTCNNEIKSILQKHDNNIIFGEYAGVGKSFASQLCSNKALHVTPYNQLCQELTIKGHQAIRIHNLMSLRDRKSVV